MLEVCANSITVAYFNAPMASKWPDNWKEVPKLERVDESTAYYRRHGRCCDAIILCNWLQAPLPLPARRSAAEDGEPAGNGRSLQGRDWVHNLRMFYLGMQDQWFTFNMFDARAWWARDAIMGKIGIPTDKATLLQDVTNRVAGEDAGQDAHDAIQYQGDYVKELIAETDYPSWSRGWLR